MPIHEDSSIIPDSTTSSPPIMTPVIKRAARTYGRTRPAADSPEDTDLSFTSNSGESGSQSSLYKTAMPFSQDEVPPSSDAEFSLTTVDQDEDEGSDEKDASRPFAFDWRKKMKEIDEAEDFDDMLHDGNKKMDASSLERQPSSPDGEKSEPRPDIATTNEDEPLGEPASKPLFLPEESDAEGSPVRRPFKRRTLKRVDSDGEDEAPKSTPQSEDPSFAFDRSPANARESPTPPTSDEDEDVPSRVMPKSQGQKKGKGKAVDRPDVIPLQFDENLTEAASSSSGKKLRTKRPTKKDLLETEKARRRLAAERNVTIPRTDQAAHNLTMTRFLLDLAAAEENKEEKLPSSQPSDVDTIKDFSSDAAQQSPQIEAWQSVVDLDQGSSSKRPIRKMVSSPSPPSKMEVRDLNQESDEDLPDVSTLAEQSTKPDMAKFIDFKKRIAEQQQVERMQVEDDSDDDDLKIVDSLDMKGTFKMEDTERKAGRRKPMPQGRKTQLHLAVMSKKSQGGTQDGKKRPGAPGGFKDREQLNAALFRTVQQENQRVIEEKEAKWSQLGGTVKSNTDLKGLSAEEIAKKYAKQALEKAQARDDGEVEMDEEDDEDASDLDWEEAEADRGSPTPSPSKPSPFRENRRVEDENDVPTSLGVDEDHDMSPTNARQRRPKAKAILDSDDEDENVPHPKASPSFSVTSSRLGASPLPPPAVLGHRGSLSSVDERTEDDGDKENDNSRVWDRSEDKENKVVASQSTSPVTAFGERKPPVNRLGSLSGSQAWSQAGVSPAGSSKGDDRRKPFQLLDDDPFASPTRPSQPNSFLAKLHLSSPAAQGRPCPDDENAKLASSSKRPALEPSFSDFFEATQQPVKSLFKSPGGPLSGLGAAFSDDEENTSGFKPMGMGDELSLTQDIGLEPAFQIGTQLQQRADQIFEKEQEYLVEAENAQNLRKEPTLYVNEIGFLTQTKPSVSTPEVYRQLPTPSQTQAMPFTQPQTSPRKPLRTLSFTASSPMHSESPVGLTRLRKRSRSPTSPSKQRIGLSRSVTAFERPPQNAFEALQAGARRKEKADEARKRLMEKSDFVENEAQESDDDEMLGFGLTKKKDDDEEEGEDLDQNDPNLVDDHKMDENEENLERVMEKHHELLEKDEQELLEYHQRAAQGDMRKKKRGQGLGLDDSDDSDLEDTEARLRRKMHKRPRIERDDINALGKNSETAAFFNVYHQDLEGEGEFDFMKESQPPDIVMADDEEDDRELSSDDEAENTKVISVHQARREAVELAQKARESGFNPDDLEWLQRMEEDEDDDGLVIKTVPPPRPHDSQAAAEEAEPTTGLPTPRSTLVSERSVMWAKQEGRSRTAGTTGRSVGGAAVTGHKVKSGGGSVRGSRSSASANSAASKGEQQRKPVKTQKSALGHVALERSARFG